jgi:hypothetical protein
MHDELFRQLIVPDVLVGLRCDGGRNSPAVLRIRSLQMTVDNAAWCRPPWMMDEVGDRPRVDIKRLPSLGQSWALLNKKTLYYLRFGASRKVAPRRNRVNSRRQID